MKYWLFKSEPFKWSWEQQKKKGKKGEEWDGIRNYQARNFMRDMKIGDRAFFYHSNKGLEVVGICEISAESAPYIRGRCTIDVAGVSESFQQSNFERLAKIS